MSSLTPTFHRYPRLPKELQMTIWELAVEFQPQQIITITPIIDNSNRRRPRKLLRPRSPQPPPLLRTCYLSRVVALKTHKSIFTSALINPIRFCPLEDILFFESTYTMGFFFRIKQVIEPGPAHRVVCASEAPDPGDEICRIIQSWRRRKHLLIISGRDIGVDCRKCKKKLPGMYGLLFLAGGKVKGAHMDRGKSKEMKELLTMVVTGRKQLKKRWGKGPWDSSFCQDCATDLNKR